MKPIILTITVLFFAVPLFSQVNNTYNLMPAPASLVRNGERFNLTDNFRVSVTGNPDPRVYAEASRFIRRIGEKTGFFLDKQGYVTAADSSATAPLLIRVKRPGKLVLNENESYILEINSQQVIVTGRNRSRRYPCIRNINATDQYRRKWLLLSRVADC